MIKTSINEFTYVRAVAIVSATWFGLSLLLGLLLCLNLRLLNLSIYGLFVLRICFSLRRRHVLIRCCRRFSRRTSGLGPHRGRRFL
jgi:hypothetical protein